MNSTMEKRLEENYDFDNDDGFDMMIIIILFIMMMIIMMMTMMFGNQLLIR